MVLKSRWRSARRSTSASPADLGLPDTFINENLATPTETVVALNLMLEFAAAQHGWHWERESQIQQNLLDFCESRSRVVIECDGAPHFTAEGIFEDLRREIECARSGFRILRFENKEIYEGANRAMDRVVRVYKARRRDADAGRPPKTTICKPISASCFHAPGRCARMLSGGSTTRSSRSGATCD